MRFDYEGDILKTIDVLNAYVDDGLSGFSDDSNDGRADRCVDEIGTVLPIENQGIPRSFLGMSLTFRENICHAYQPYLIDQIVNLMGCKDAKPTLTPLKFNFDIPVNTGPAHPGFTNVPYNRIIGMMNFLSSCTRPDITNAVRTLASHTLNPSKRAWIQLQNTAQYLNTTRNWGICFGLLSPFEFPGIDQNHPTDQNAFTTFADSDHAKDETDRVSVSGFVSLFCGSPINWGSKKQTGTVALSSMEAEVIAGCNGIKDAHWIRKMWNEFEGQKLTINIGIDNQAAIYFGNADADHSRAKHIDIRYYFIKNAVRSNTVKLWYCPTEYNPADLFTKPLRPDRHLMLMQLVGMRQIEEVCQDD